MARRLLVAMVLLGLLLDGPRLCLASPGQPTGHDAQMPCCKKVASSAPLVCPCRHRGAVIAGDSWLPAALPTVVALPLPDGSSAVVAIAACATPDRRGPPPDQPPRAA